VPLIRFEYVKYGRILQGAAVIIGVAAAIVYWLRAGDAPVKPEGWMVNAAIALSRESIATGPHEAPSPSGERQAAALRAVQSGQQLRVQRRFKEAEAAFREAVEADPADADSWADLADCAAAAAGNDLTVSREAIAHALRIDPKHRKALWLRASLELQERRYPAAAATWRELQSLIPPGSPDARVVAANIAEADALARSFAAGGGRGT
jgi:tetratricopeptide (TPR) repeat protein